MTVQFTTDDGEVVQAQTNDIFALPPVGAALAGILLFTLVCTHWDGYGHLRGHFHGGDWRLVAPADLLVSQQQVEIESLLREVLDGTETLTGRMDLPDNR
mgnify:CR=1 FL=1